MAQQSKTGKTKLSRDQRIMRRNQLIFIGLSVLLILAMVLSLVRF